MKHPARMLSLLRLMFVLLGFAGLLTAWPSRSFAQPVASAPAATASEPCGGPVSCFTNSGRYRLRVPAGWDGQPGLPALIFFHGWQETPEGILAMQEITAFADAFDLVLVVPEGQGKTWSYPGSPSRHRDDFRFVEEVLDDLPRRFPVDEKRIWASGFSQGGSMVWNIACQMPERFLAFAPVAGGFWEPLPAACKQASTRIFHVHGTTDATVPMKGRSLRNGLWKQGDIAKGWTILAKANGCQFDLDEPFGHMAPQTGSDLPLACTPSRSCPANSAMMLCLHGGGHHVSGAHLESAWSWITTLTPAGAIR
ncbi:MAG: alpha/beta hydrolase family esterase [Bosea sp. (in: a-proteobacteria)]